ncbi:hypothetical protein JX265_005621 [Neoarthrinium moseri]|uniref:Heterokaryon incompatibility domain-containing protein n=1 Tax=Neoarthrinium moseri TaxID=1658444 RepID=A0A9Q0AQ37_9PEZI|nr:hypothetical protein JX265_005621 [Neoarthrinium moseri]
MRLIDVQTLRLVNIFNPQQTEYAILSHTWGSEEVTFQEWEQVNPSGAIKGQCPHVHKSEYTNKIKAKSGYQKILGACEQAQRDGLQYLWCDTNCINKESSAELSEAINSMFAWYHDSRICYAHLPDVSVPRNHFRQTCLRQLEDWFARNDDDVSTLAEFSGSRWWTRGWTLQELLAPGEVEFYALDWTPLGSRTSLRTVIAKVTNIHEKVLADRNKIPTFSIAQRMSWASDRKTTVIEDMAYCLLGIFGINMPMLYGQGIQAFQKLQEEIIKISDDQSIFAWKLAAPDRNIWTGALAKSPSLP